MEGNVLKKHWNTFIKYNIKFQYKLFVLLHNVPTLMDIKDPKYLYPLPNIPISFKLHCISSGPRKL